MKRIYLSLIILHSIVFSSDYKIEKRAFGLHFGSTNTKFISKQFQGLTNNSLMINPIYNGTNDNLSYEIDIFFTDNDVFARKLFIKYNFKDTNLVLGRFNTTQSSEDFLLSSGSMIESGNALGVPRIGTITTKKYNNHNVNFSFYHGQLNRNKYMVEKPFLHEKKLYYSTTFLKNIFSIGLSHSVIWGGETTDNGKQPERLEDFVRAVFGNPGDNNATNSDQINALGESIGMWDFSLERKYNSYQVKMYHQNFFEDGSGLSLDDKMNGFDGLWGIKIQKDKFKSVYEYLKTTYQGGSVHPPGLDSYYWSGAYRPGWVFNGQTIGNMIISPQNNRVKAHFVSIGFFEDNHNFFLISFLKSEEFYPYTGNTLDYESLKEDFSNKHYKEATLTIKKDFGNYSLHTYFGTNFESEKMFTSLFYNF